MIVDSRIILYLSVYIIGSSCSANDEETHSKIEYIQIFKNIPTLFEYLLEMLETRPEILERNDVTVFVKNKQNLKRDARESLNNKNESDLKKQNIISNRNELKRDTMNSYSNRNNGDTREFVGNLNGNKKTLNDFAKEIDPDIVRHEYGNSIKQLDGHNEDKEIDETTFNTVNTRDESTPATETSVELDIKDRLNQSLNLKPIESVTEIFNDNSNIFGVDLNQLSPEEVEQQILMVEQMLEEHNSEDDEPV